MKNFYLIASIVLLLLLASNFLFQQDIQNLNVMDGMSQSNWGYSYDSTLVYLENLKQSSFVKIDSIGESIQGRAIWMVNILESSMHFETKYRVAIHARTHPNEVQSQWLTQKIINILIGDSEIAKILRHRVIFNIVPMYNPDGVELEYPRKNANGIDLERNWFVDAPEPEVFALKKKYLELMNTNIPIEIMLNMHGDGGADKAYFYYHHENGTSVQFTEDEKRFISYTQQYFPDVIDDWDAQITWTTGNPMLFPESWFWENYQESVMAITFEEITIPNRFDTLYTKTANALLNGIADYLDIRSSVDVDSFTKIISPYLEQNYPNPFNPTTNIKFYLLKNDIVTLKVYNSLGQVVATLIDNPMVSGIHEVEFNAQNLASGIYVYILRTSNFTSTKKMLLVK